MGHPVSSRNQTRQNVNIAHISWEYCTSYVVFGTAKKDLSQGLSDEKQTSLKYGVNIIYSIM